MIKVLSTKAIRDADQYTIEHEPISSLNLMERAAGRAYDRLEEIFQLKQKKHKFVVICGSGNNGGDGLVIAGKLLEAGHEVVLYMLHSSRPFAEELQENLNRLSIAPIFLTEEEHRLDLDGDAVLIDALFGTGLSRVVEGVAGEVIGQINQHAGQVVSVDLPSGLFADEGILEKNQMAVKATYTLSFQSPKRSFFFPESYPYVGQWELIPIGLDQNFIDAVDCDSFLLTANDVGNIIKPRNPFSHKGDFGHSYLMVGSKGKMGAAVMAAKACLRSGTGLLTLQLPQCGLQVLQTTVPEAMVSVDENPNCLSELKIEPVNYTIGIGPGIGTDTPTKNLMKLLIQQNRHPMVIDADGINILAENSTWISFLPVHSILTPHFGEFQRLVGKWSSAEERMQKLRDFVSKYQLYVVLKGKYSVIACPDGKVFFNNSGNPGMAKGGSGDALTGILTGLLAQSYSPLEACLLGVYLHGLAGDLAANEMGQECMLPSDLIRSLSPAFARLKTNRSE